MSRTEGGIAIVGAGAVGSALGRNLTARGRSVVFGVRSIEGHDELLAACGGRGEVATVAKAIAGAEIVFHAVPGEVAVSSLEGIDLSGKIVVDCNNAVGWDDGPVWAPPDEGSITAALAAAHPEARVVKGFATFGFEIHANPALPTGPADVHLAGDDAEAKQRVAELAEASGFRPIDCGPLRNAAVLENLAILWIQLAQAEGRGRSFAFQIDGR